jgi:hypothetical protein
LLHEPTSGKMPRISPYHRSPNPMHIRTFFAAATAAALLGACAQGEADQVATTDSAAGEHAGHAMPNVVTDGKPHFAHGMARQFTVS